MREAIITSLAIIGAGTLIAAIAFASGYTGELIRLRRGRRK